MRQIRNLILLVGLAAAFAFTQTTQGLISGRIIDSISGRPVSGAEIRCASYEGGPDRVTHSGAEGYFALPLLSPGFYRVHIAAGGYQPQEVHQLEVPVAGRLEFQFRIRQLSDVWEAGQYRSVLLPNSQTLLTFYGPDVDTSRAASFEAPHAGKGALEASISQVVNPDLVSRLPLAGRDIYTTLILQPGVTAGTADARGLGLSVNGQRPTSSNFLLDGIENNNYLVSGPLMSVAPEAVQEYRISTSNFSAEYGGTAGVLANAVTRGGGNGWHGIAYVYGKNDALNGNDFQRNLTPLPRPPLHEWQSGFQVGGPVLMNRLFTSTSLEYLRSRGFGDPLQAQLPTTGFLSFLQDAAGFSPGARYAQQLLQQFPIAFPNSPALSASVDLSLPDSVNRWLAVERLDYSSPNGVHRLMGRVAEARLDRPDFLWSPYRGFSAPLIQNTLGIVAALTSTINPHITNEARTGWSSDDLQWERPHPEIPTLISADQTLLPGSLAFYSYRNRSRSTELSDELVWSRGPHLLQFGGGVLLRGLDGFLTAGRDGRYTFDTILEFATGSPSEFSALLNHSALPAYQLPGYDRNYRYDEFHLFLQDTFRVTSRLVFNYGVRYENYGSPTNTGSVKDLQFQPGSGTTLSQRITGGSLTAPSGDETIYLADNRGWAGRFGGSYDLTGTGRLLVRGGYGIFYDKPFDNLWANERLNGSALSNFDILSATTNFLLPYLPQLASFQLQRGNSGFPNVTWVDPRLRNGYAQNFFLGVQQQVASALTFEVNGTGSLGRKLITTDILNRNSSDNAAVAPILYRANQGASSYTALAALARYRTSRVQFQAAYTWSHSIDNQSSPLAGDFFDLAFVRFTSATAYEPPAGFTIQQDSRIDKGNSDFDQRHNLVLTSTVDLPQPPGRSRWALPLRDWRFATLSSFRSGFPYTVYASNSILGVVNRRADLVNPNAGQNVPVPGGRLLLNPAAFANPIAANGTLGRNALEGPGLINVDLSLNRAIPLKWLGEVGRVNLRADVFNLLNHANLGSPDPLMGDTATFGIATFGRKAQPTGFPGLLPLNETARQIQLMIRIEW